MGGIALNNPVMGRAYQPWVVSYVNGVILVNPLDQPVEFSLPVADVRTISLAFDNNMSVVLTWVYATGAKLYYFDTLTSQYIERDFPGVHSSRVCVDEPANFYNQDSDVIFGYTKRSSTRSGYKVLTTSVFGSDPNPRFWLPVSTTLFSTFSEALYDWADRMNTTHRNTTVYYTNGTVLSNGIHTFEVRDTTAGTVGWRINGILYGTSGLVPQFVTEPYSSNGLYWRQQRDRYDIERLVGYIGDDRQLVKMGMNIGHRLQFKLMRRV